MFEVDLDPLAVLQVVHDHLCIESSVFNLATVYYHALLEDRGAVIFAGAHRVAFGFYDFHTTLVDVVLEQLVGALAELSFTVEHEAASECVDFVIVADRGVALAALDVLSACVGHALPDHVVPRDSALNHLLAGIVVDSTNQEHLIVANSEGGALPWSWKPFRLLGFAHFDIRLENLQLRQKAKHAFRDDMLMSLW